MTVNSLDCIQMFRHRHGTSWSFAPGEGTVLWTGVLRCALYLIHTELAVSIEYCYVLERYLQPCTSSIYAVPKTVSQLEQKKQTAYSLL